MQRIQAIESENASNEVKDLYQQVENELGMLPNLIKTLANAPIAAKAFIQFKNLVAQGVLPVALREKISLRISEANGCSYCVSAHCALSKGAGLADEEVRDSRQGQSPDRKTDLAIKFAERVMDARGSVTTDEIDGLRDVGYSDQEITEIITVVIFTQFSNYFNNAAGTVNDFPKAAVLAA
ncbi:MAG: peroxidase-related enzyme [Nitrospina sp.]|nr:peroxidase-related enzyme [Nitrospina sp.]MBT6716524.1 peroxidase-related enzyme [Nitrospina sp.]